MWVCTTENVRRVPAVRGQPAEELELRVGGVADLAVHAARHHLEHPGAELAQHARERA